MSRSLLRFFPPMMLEKSPGPILRRSRWSASAWIALGIALGLASRRLGPSLPRFVSAYAGDTLWAFVVFFGVGFVWPGAPTRRVALAAMGVSTLVEVSQLWHAQWIDAIRQTTPGALVLGRGFVWSDLICYAAGVGLGVAINSIGANWSEARSTRDEPR